MSEVLFQTMPSYRPIIYGYTDSRYPGMIKVGYTDRPIEERMKEHYPTLLPTDKKPYQVVFTGPAMRADGSVFMDKLVHHYLEDDLHCSPSYQNGKKTEWYRCSLSDLKKAHHAALYNLDTAVERIYDFKMRPEQIAAVKKTAAYYRSAGRDVSLKTPKFLWNAKMRFGKTFASYELAKEMGFKKILVLTFKPAVKSAWREDLLTHKDFEGWQFLSQPHNDPYALSLDAQYEKADKTRPIVCFGSFQDLLGIDKDTGAIKAHNEWIHATNWNLVVFDEYHFGAWRSRAKDLFEAEDEESFSATEKDDEKKAEKTDVDVAIDESFLPISTDHYLFLSGTPFRALNSGEFIEEQIYSWTYSDEQKAKSEWKGPDNPYASLPHMVMMTYKMPDSITKIAMQGEFNEFDLNVFFEAKSKTGKKEDSEFVLKDAVQKWLDLIRGSYLETSVDSLKLGKKPPFPFSDTRLMSMLRHTLWFLPSVASCYAMRNLLREAHNTFYHDFEVIVCAGNAAGQGSDALIPVLEKMGNPLETRTITLSCGKLTTGVTVKPWTGVFMLRNLSQPETYFQTAFRVQSPWTYTDEDGHTKIIKEECYVFDFALNRTLRQLSEYSCKLNPSNDKSAEQKVGEFINFLPVLAYDDGVMRQINAGEILDIAMSGTSATLLARRWESALLVNVDNATLERLLNNDEAMKALMSIEGFRSLNQDIQTIINNSNAVKKAKREGEKNKSAKEKKELSEQEKEMKSKRKQIQEKLIKFATRIPVFMYLTDFREQTLRDVITKLEPELFRKVTGLYVKDFELLVSLGLFNDSLMNDAIYKFRRYEERSLDYTGINKHAGENIGGWSTSMSSSDVEAIYGIEADEDPNVLNAGDEVDVSGYGRCLVDHFTRGKVYLVEKSTGKMLPNPYAYPHVMTLGTIRKVSKGGKNA